MVGGARLSPWVLVPTQGYLTHYLPKAEEQNLPLQKKAKNQTTALSAAFPRSLRVCSGPPEAESWVGINPGR
jgi:hypothetical protein